MIDNPEVLWRVALRDRGSDWVKAQLQSRPGRSDDVVLDVVFAEPYPTRAFCQAWCAEQDNKLVQFSGYTKAVMIAGILFFVFVLGAFQKWTEPQPRPSPPFLTSQGGSTTNGFGSAPISNKIPTAMSSAASTQSATVPAVCAYTTYQTAACRTGP